MTQPGNTYLEALGARTGIRVEFYDPTGSRYGFPTFPFRNAPDGLATRRQLRSKGLRPNGQDPIAQILWRHRKQRRIAYLYRIDLAAPKRTATAAQLAALDKANRAKRVCPACGQLKPYQIPRRTGACLDCESGS
ncbi:RRQRL motif-containing zinc-binding protein [Actinoplanes sp. NPDC051633]|uniref:RRQRL motif-containing zinc-binding protein n=1 Tax=Actinoplanes sp. NPDC051633 TaxID=3155670 RepID=UPI003429627C